MPDSVIKDPSPCPEILLELSPYRGIVDCKVNYFMLLNLCRLVIRSLGFGIRTCFNSEFCHLLDA